jgi:hypothetical protein
MVAVWVGGAAVWSKDTTAAAADDADNDGPASVPLQTDVDGGMGPAWFWLKEDAVAARVCAGASVAALGIPAGRSALAGVATAKGG